MFRAPSDCLQYFTGKTGTVYSYNFAGAQVLRMFFWNCRRYVFAQFLSGMDYTNCIRTEKGYCAIEWKEKTGATPGRWNDIWMDVNVHCWLTVPSLVSFVLTTVLRSKLDNLDNHNNISDDDNNLMRATSMMLPIFPDPFQVFATASTAVVLACPSMQVYVPNMRLLCFIMNFAMSVIVIMKVIKKRRTD